VIRIGEYNKLKVVRRADFGYYLSAESGNTSDDILLPNKSAGENEIIEGEEIEVFVYRDSDDRPIATMKQPLAKVGDLAYLEVVAITKIGAFINFGLERDILVPIKEQNYKLKAGAKYLFYIYLDKSNRIAATTRIDKYLDINNTLQVGDEIWGIAYGYQTNNSVQIAIEGLYRGIILEKEYFSNINPGDKLNLRVKKYYEDGIIGLTPRQGRMYEKDIIEEKILKYLTSHNGVMPYNDKSDPNTIKEVFGTSKNYFKNALGGLMKKGLIIQNENETVLKKQ
jgi:predicted RNA-binding protein (virulence factor B family)